MRHGWGGACPIFVLVEGRDTPWGLQIGLVAALRLRCLINDDTDNDNNNNNNDNDKTTTATNTTQWWPNGGPSQAITCTTAIPPSPGPSSASMNSTTTIPAPARQPSPPLPLMTPSLLPLLSPHSLSPLPLLTPSLPSLPSLSNGVRRSGRGRTGEEFSVHVLVRLEEPALREPVRPACSRGTEEMINPVLSTCMSSLWLRNWATRATEGQQKPPPCVS